MLMFISLYIILATGLAQFYRLTTRTARNLAAQTVGLSVLAGLSCLVFLPFYDFRLPTSPWAYLFLGLSSVFCALNNRLMASARKNLEASSISILQQSYTVMMTLSGFILFKDQVTPLKILGIILIICGNILVFLQRKKISKIKKRKKLKYICTALLACLCSVAACLIDVNYSAEFSLPLYIAFTYLISAPLVLIGSRSRVADVAKEFKRANKRNFLITGFCWGVQYLVLISAYAVGEVSIVAPLASLVVFSNVVVGHLWFNERDYLLKKIIAALLATIGVVLISL